MVKWTLPAKQDLRQVYDYIASDSKFYAQKVADEIIEKSNTLKLFPEIGRVVPEVGDPHIREVIVYSYRLVYEVSGKNIEVLALIHAKRNFMSQFEMSPKKGQTKKSV
mgnify:FL=1